MTGRRQPPGIPEPAPTVAALMTTVAALKEAVEQLSGARGLPLDYAVRREDLVALGLVTEADLGKIKRRQIQTG